MPPDRDKRNSPRVKNVDLTSREVEIFYYFLSGYTAGEIGLKLNVTEETIKSHRKKILAKLNARNMVHAATLHYLGPTPPEATKNALPSMVLQARLKSLLRMLMNRLENELNEELERLLRKAMRDLRS